MHNKEDLVYQLPKVGDKLRIRPTSDKAGISYPERPCTVTYVNRANFWYEVEFLMGRCPVKECFKLPTPRYG